jgi:hypothetical protein
MRCTHLVLMLGLLASFQQPAPPGLPQAMARLQAQDPAGALAIAEQVVAREPGNARAWRVLAVAAKGMKDLDRSLAALHLPEWAGEAPHDQFGWIARPVGDVDRDGVTDVVTSAPAPRALRAASISIRPGPVRCCGRGTI